MPAGRPTKFNPEFCDTIVDLGAKGYSLTACAGKLGVCRDTIYAWASDFPEFSYALKLHQAARCAFLEDGLLAGESGPLVTSRIFALKNTAPQEWRDKHDFEHTGANGGPIQTETKFDATLMTPEERDTMRAILLAAQARKENGA